MGDRSNLVVQFDKKLRIYMYSHSGGNESAVVLRNVCKAGVRLEDESYFARILFNALTADAYSQETGYGISPYITDNEHPILVVHPDKNKIWVEDEEGNKIARGPWTMQEFGALSDEEAIAAMDGPQEEEED